MPYDDFGSRRELASFYDKRRETDYHARKQRAYEHSQSVYRVNAARADRHLASLRSTSRPTSPDTSTIRTTIHQEEADQPGSSDSWRVDFDRTRKRFQELLRDPKRVAKLVKETFEHHANRDFAAAVKTGQSAAKYCARDADLFIVLGDSFIELERYGAAINFLNRAIKASPDRADAYYLRGFAYESKQRWEDACRDYTNASRLDKDSRLYTRARAEALMELGRFEDAITELQSLLKSGLADADIFAALGFCHEMCAQYEAALDCFNKVLELDSSSPTIIKHRGRMHLELGDYDAAHADFSRAVAAREDDPDARRWLGRSALLLGNHREAVTQLEAALRKQPSDYISRIRLGSAYLALAKHEYALDQWRQAQSLAEQSGDTETSLIVSGYIRKMIGEIS